MNKQLLTVLHRYAIAAAKALEGKLPDHPAHPYGRIPIAHIYDVIIRVMGCPAKECNDNRYDDLIKIINFCRDYPNEPHCASELRKSIAAEPHHEKQTLDQFFGEQT